MAIEAAGARGAVASRPVRLRSRLGLAAGLIVLVAVLAGAGIWVATPSGADLDQRVVVINPHPLRPSDVPPLLSHAATAAEDERFWIHHGLDTVGTARALLVDVTQLCACQGGSTITQQLVNVAYYSGQGRLQRKVPAMAVALKVELGHDKPTILADYLSVVPSGYALVGARAAACAFFGHDLDRLTLAEAAEIAGVIAAPSVYDPRRGPELARSRRGYVLGRMVDLGYATPAAARSAADEPVLGSGPGC